jgi:hypothetical protein
VGNIETITFVLSKQIKTTTMNASPANVKAIYVEKGNTAFATKRYNGSYYPIKMETEDGLDYSIYFWESWYEFQNGWLDDENKEDDYELSVEQLESLFVDFVEELEDCGYNIITTK